MKRETLIKWALGALGYGAGLLFGVGVAWLWVKYVVPSPQP